MLRFFKNRLGRDFKNRDRFTLLIFLLSEKIFLGLVDRATTLEVGQDVFFVVSVKF
jgi:hypothetical protein